MRGFISVLHILLSKHVEFGRESSRQSTGDASLNINQPRRESLMNHLCRTSTIRPLTLFALLFTAAFAAFAGNTPETAPPLSETLLHSFSNTGDGAYPAGGMILGSDGNFYGTTCGTAFAAGGPGVTSYGSVFKMTPDGTLTTVYTFGGGIDGNCPDWELTEGPDGNFYGVTKGGNATTPYGTIFKVTPAGSLMTLYTFCGTTSCVLDASPKSPGFVGQQPALTLGNDGNFYGTSLGGNSSGCGVVFKITPSGSLTLVYQFTCGADGGYPEPGLLLGADGNLYGTAKTSSASTGAIEVGEVFKLTPGGTLTVLHEFCSSAGCSSDYGQPAGAPVLGPDNNLYGVANFVSGTGVIYEVTTSGTVNILSSITLFINWTMRLAGNDGNIYGGGEGYVFQYTPGGGLYFWNGVANSNQYGAAIGLVQDGKGNFYGQSSEGGSSLVGSIFTATFAAPGVTLTASPTTITLGQNSTLTWSSTDETSCTAGGAWSGNKATSGVLVVTPTAIGMNSFTLTCTGADGSANSSATVSVLAPAPSVTLTVNPTSITVGQNATLTWSSANAATCTASNAWSGAKATSGTQSVTPTQIGTNTYTLTCAGAGGSFIASAPLMVNNPPPPTVTLSVAPTSITLGQSATLSWSSTNATTCTASNAWSGAKATSGSTVVTPTATGTQTYTLSCSGAGSTHTTSDVMLTVNAPAAASGSGHGGGGSLGSGTVLGLAFLLAWRTRRKSHPSGLSPQIIIH
jgi:uncharacterized repeat protein (TIGR03803 family)